jgi:hypothetical protein
MALNDFNFNPPEGWNNETEFPDYPQASEVRPLFQKLFDQIKVYLGLVKTEITTHLADYTNNAIKKDANEAVNIINNPISESASVKAVTLTPVLNPNANQTTIGLNVQPTINKNAVGTHPMIAGTYLSIPAINGSGAMVTDAATLYIQGQPTGTDISTALALFINGGNSRIRDRLGVGEVTIPLTTLHIVTNNGSNHLTLERTGTSAGKAILATDNLGLSVLDASAVRAIRFNYDGTFILRGNNSTHGECTGSPEGIIAATVGSTRYRTDAGELWVKTTGTGNTGWKKVTVA